MRSMDTAHNHRTFIVAVAALALIVMGCGFLPNLEGTSGHPLVGPRWQVRSETLGVSGTSMDAVFNSDGSFTGQLKARPGSMMDKDQTIQGTWHIAEPLLILQYEIINEVGNKPFTSKVELSIRLHDITQNRIRGLDEWGRLWEFERRD